VPRDHEKVVVVSASTAGVPPMFGGEGGDIRDVVAAKMREVYLDTAVPPFLDEVATRLLTEGRSEFERLGLRQRSIVEIDGDTFLFPWAGSIALGTLALALKGSGLGASTRRFLLEIDWICLRRKLSPSCAASREHQRPPPCI